MKQFILPIAFLMLGLTVVPEKISVDIEKSKHYLPPAQKIANLQELVKINEHWKNTNRLLDSLEIVADKKLIAQQNEIH